ncbi:hypothetical protein [uncultured Duncaniella sp.]|uniref:hypothetical protein n=2 Tax=uncultured Duncaniella sp. TaxID=2768039 RepID=UPI002615AD2F|nr:hypothetical protein [uncultured Duncaniella sp.]
MIRPAFHDYLIETQDKKNPLAITTSMPQYPTGYMYLDYGTGSYLTVCDDDEVPLYQYHNVGICCGSVNVLISKSQGGKTSLALAMGAAIIERYITMMLYRKSAEDIKRATGMKGDVPELTGMPFIQILDTEKTLPVDYAKKVARYTNKLTERHIIINPITTDRDLMTALEKHVKFKVDHMQKVPMPMLDMFGKPIIDYPPTILIIDSMSQLLLEDCDDPSSIKKKDATIMDIYQTATQNTAGARRAKIITALNSQLVNYAKRYNIIIFSINHINKMLPVNGIPVKQYRGLRAGETIGGGEKAIYLAANILRLDVIKNVGGQSSTSLNLGDGVKGHVAIASWIKSKSNSKSNQCQLVYTNQAGYDPLLSNLYFAKENGDLIKSGNGFCVRDFEQYKFTLKNYAQVFGDHPELFSAFYDELRDKCSVLLDNPEEARKADEKLLQEIREEIHDEFKRSDAMDMDDIFMSVYNS